MSLALPAHSSQRVTIWSCASAVRRSAAVAAVSAMAIAMAVSSVHSPGSQPSWRPVMAMTA